MLIIRAVSVYAGRVLFPKDSFIAIINKLNGVKDINGGPSESLKLDVTLERAFAVTSLEATTIQNLNVKHIIVNQLCVVR